jgi:hypothetical protein
MKALGVVSGGFFSFSPKNQPRNRPGRAFKANIGDYCLVKICMSILRWLKNDIGDSACETYSQITYGNQVSIVLEHWGSGRDQTMRRWTLADGYWQCMDSREIARKPALGSREYAFVIATVIAFAWGAYSLMGHHISSMARGAFIHP